jgi:hypothetical protein
LHVHNLHVYSYNPAFPRLKRCTTSDLDSDVLCIASILDHPVNEDRTPISAAVLQVMCVGNITAHKLEPTHIGTTGRTAKQCVTVRMAMLMRVILMMSSPIRTCAWFMCPIAIRLPRCITQAFSILIAKLEKSIKQRKCDKQMSVKTTMVPPAMHLQQAATIVVWTSYMLWSAFSSEQLAILQIPCCTLQSYVQLIVEGTIASKCA